MIRILDKMWTDCHKTIEEIFTKILYQLLPCFFIFCFSFFKFYRIFRLFFFLKPRWDNGQLLTSIAHNKRSIIFNHSAFFSLNTFSQIKSITIMTNKIYCINQKLITNGSQHLYYVNRCLSKYIVLLYSFLVICYHRRHSLLSDCQTKVGKSMIFFCLMSLISCG